MSDECQHDWRVNPNKLAPGLPPKQFLFCIKCSKETIALFHFKMKENRRNDPTTWKRYTGEPPE